MEFRSIRQTSHINGSNRNPGATEHDKALVWDNNILNPDGSFGKFKYISYNSLSVNSKTNDGYVTKGSDAILGSQIWKLDADKNPDWRAEEYLKLVARQPGGDSALFTMNSGEIRELTLGALAWEDSVPVDITLPGNTKILYDDNDSIAGDSSFTFDKVNKLLNLTAFTGIQVKNNSDASLQGVLQYFGGNNLLLAHGVTRSLAWSTNLLNNVNIGETAGGSLTTGQNNVFLGHYSASNVSNNIQGSLYLGNYSGRLETDNNKFYVGMTNYGTLNEYREGSLMYGDFSTGQLRVNNRLEVPQEVKIGTFNVLNTPSWGMLQFIETLTPGEYKPQFYDGASWQDFASGTNYYLNTVSKGTADVGTTDNAFKLTFDMVGIPDFTLQLGANAFNSNIIPTASPDLLAGYIQLSSGDNSDLNSGFTHSTKLLWTEGSQNLFVDGSINIGVMPLTSPTAGKIVFDGNHFWGYALDESSNFNWRRIDSDPDGVGENNTASNIGLTGIGLFYQKDGIDLQFKTIERIDDRVVLVDDALNKSINIDLDINPSATNITPVTSKTYSGSVLGSIVNSTTPNPELRFKKLISNTVQISENANEVILEVTGVGGGESNSALNVGTGIQVYKDKVGADLRFKTVTTAGDHTLVSSNVDGNHIDIDVEDIVIADLGGGIAVLGQNANSFEINQKTFIDGLATEVATDGDEITVGVSQPIPYVSWIPVPEWTRVGPVGNGKVKFVSNFNADVRTGITVGDPTIIAELNIGTGLSYDSASNTLTSTSSGGSSTDYRLTSITTLDNTITFNVTDEYGSGVDTSVDLVLGDLAFEDSVNSAYSVSGDGTIANPLKLTNDIDVPGSLRYYGTNGDGLKGFFDLSEISTSLILGETSTTAYRGDRGKIAYDHSQSAHNYVTKVSSTDNHAVRFNGTSGEVQDSLVIIDDLGGVEAVSATITGLASAGNSIVIADSNGELSGIAGTEDQYVAGDGTVKDFPDISGQVNTDWDSTTGVSELLNKPVILTQLAALTGTGSIVKTVSGVEVDSSIGWNNGVQTLSGVTPTFNPSAGLHFNMTVSTIPTITFEGLVAGMSGNISVLNASGVRMTFAGYTFHISPSVYWATNQVQLSGGTNADKFTWYYDGSVVTINGVLDVKTT